MKYLEKMIVRVIDITFEGADISLKMLSVESCLMTLP